MGASTNCIFGYGIDLGELEKSMFDYSPEKLSLDMGISLKKAKTLKFEEVLKFYLSDANDSELGFEIHCSDDCPMYLLFVADSTVSAHRGYAESVGELFLRTEEFHKMFMNDDNLRKLGLNIKKIREEFGEPNFLMAPMWGA